MEIRRYLQFKSSKKCCGQFTDFLLLLYRVYIPLPTHNAAINKNGGTYSNLGYNNGQIPGSVSRIKLFKIIFAELSRKFAQV